MELTPKVVAFLASLEGLTLESYLDTGNTWTWALGVTDASGHTVGKYKDKPSTLEEALSVSVWLIQQKYLPTVLKAFKEKLNEAQLAAALSFHWNTGKIGQADWVADYNDHKAPESYQGILSWSSHGLLTGRRMIERELFFKGTWPSDLRTNLYPVLKPSYHPDIRHAQKIDILPTLESIIK